MAKSLPRIILLFAGGSTLQIEGGGVMTVNSPKDIQAWMDQVPELALIAKVEPVFVMPDGKHIEIPDWNILAQKVMQYSEDYDGFVILQGVDTMLYASAFLSYVLKDLAKPVVITGSPLTPTLQAAKEAEKATINYRNLGVRANLINAIQVSTFKVPEVTIAFGNQVIRANRARKSPNISFNMFEADERDVMGRVDFGIKLKSESEKTVEPKKIHLTEVKPVNLKILTIHPTFEPEELNEAIKNLPEGILIQTFMQEGWPESLQYLLKVANDKEIPVIVLNPYFALDTKLPNVQMVSGISLEALYAKFLWALSKARNPQIVLQLISQNRAGEFGLEEKKGK